MTTMEHNCIMLEEVCVTSLLPTTALLKVTLLSFKLHLSFNDDESPDITSAGDCSNRIVKTEMQLK
jgi:hypothetical protein